MKFKKDNSAVALTQKMKDDVIAEKEAELAREAAKRKEISDKIAWVTVKRDEVQGLEFKLNEMMEPVLRRMVQYGTVPDQLDRLWHDIDDGRIQADKTSANSWYSTIKSIKDSVSIEENWDTKAQELTLQMQNITGQVTANNV